MTIPSSPKLLVTGGCHDGDHINDEDEDDDTKPERKEQPGEPRKGMRDLKNSSWVHRSSLTSNPWPVWMARQVAHQSPLSADPPASLAELRQGPLGDSSSGTANQLVQSWAIEIRLLKRQGDQEKQHGAPISK